MRRERLDLSAAPPRARWTITAIAILLMVATLPIPDGLVRWVVIAVILVAWFVGMVVAARRASRR